MRWSIYCSFGLSPSEKPNRSVFQIAKNNFDSGSPLMSFSFLFGNLLGVKQPSKLFMSAVKICCSSKMFPYQFNNTGNCLLTLIYPCQGLPQSNLEQIGVTELSQRHNGRWSWVCGHGFDVGLQPMHPLPPLPYHISYSQQMHT